VCSVGESKSLWVFDNDGTLYDDTGAQKHFLHIMYQYSSKLLGINPQETESVVTTLKDKWSTEFSVIALMRELNLEYSEIVSSTYMKLDLVTCGIVAPDLIRAHTLERITAPKIVFTNNPSLFANKVLSYVGLVRYFDDIVGMEETEFYGKPHLRAFEIVQTRHPNIGRFIFCDDSLKNLDAAKEFGWNTLYYNPRGDLDNLEHGHQIISSFSELSKVI